MADNIMDEDIRAACARQVPGDTHRCNYSEVGYHNLLLPMFIAAYIFNDKSYQVVVNGQ